MKAIILKRQRKKNFIKENRERNFNGRRRWKRVKMLNISSNIIRTKKREVRVMRINFRLTTLFFFIEEKLPRKY